MKNIVLKILNDDKISFGMGMVPEFLREGSALEDARSPDRIVLGTDDQKTKDVLIDIFEPWDSKKIFVSSRTAEMIKYVNNSLLALMISTSNELANLSREIGNINFNDVVRGVKEDRRWNTKFVDGYYPQIFSYFKPGPGFGGSCFPKRC